MTIAEMKCFRAALAALLFLQCVVVVNATPVRFDPSVEARVAARTSELVAAFSRSGFAPLSVISSARPTKKFAGISPGGPAALESAREAAIARGAANAEPVHMALVVAPSATSYFSRAPPIGA